MQGEEALSRSFCTKFYLLSGPQLELKLNNFQRIYLLEYLSNLFFKDCGYEVIMMINERIKTFFILIPKNIIDYGFAGMRIKH